MAESKNLNEVLKSISKKYGDNVVKYGIDSLDIDGTLSLGSPGLDFAIYGGIPEGRVVEFSGAEGSGKAQPLWSKVFTPNGYTTMGELTTEDVVIDGKGNPTRVTGIYDRGILPVYKVTFNDKTFTYCAGDHLWKVYNHSYGKKPSVEVLTTDQLMSRNLHAGCWSYSVDVPVIDCWKDNDIELDPYLVGALIGDGSLHNNLGFTNCEEDVVANVRNRLNKYGMTLVNYEGAPSYEYDIKQQTPCHSPYIYHYRGETYTSLKSLQNVAKDTYAYIYKYINAYGKNDVQAMSQYYSHIPDFSIELNPEFNKRKSFINLLNKYELTKKSVDKHIPMQYLYSSVDTRAKLLQGLIDTDGYTGKDGATSISTSSKQLSEDIQFLCRTLGCRVCVSYQETSNYTDKFGVHTSGPNWEIRIKNPTNIQIASSRKHTERINRQCKLPSSKWWRSIVDIEYYGNEECRCIMVESDEHTYLTDDLICTHNTTNAFLACASYQKAELKRNPDNPRCIVFLDNEGTADPVWAAKLGYDMSENAAVKTVCIRPEAQSAEEIFDMALEMLKTGEVGLLVFDSIATLVPAQIADESMEKQQMGGIAKALTRFANTAIGLLRKYKATLIAINQVRENMTGYGDPLTTPGGRAWKHACSMRLMFKRGDFFDEEGNILTKKAESPAGHIIECYVLKTKVCKWDRKLGMAHLNYTKGIDWLQDTIDVGVHLGLIDNSVQGSFKLVDPDTGELLKDELGNEIKIRGKKNVYTYFQTNPVEARKLYDRCYSMLSKKDDPFIKSFETLLNIDVSEKLGVDITTTNLEEM